MFELFKAQKFKIVFLRKEYNTTNIVGVKILSKTSDIIKLGKKSYAIDYSKPAYNFKLEKIYLIDYELGGQISLDSSNACISPEKLDTIVSNKLIREITSGVLDNKFEKMMFLIVGLIIGALVSAVIMLIVHQNAIVDLYEQIPRQIQF